MNGSARGLAGCVFFFAGRRTPTRCSFNFELGGPGGQRYKLKKLFVFYFADAGIRYKSKLVMDVRPMLREAAATHAQGVLFSLLRRRGHPCPMRLVVARSRGHPCPYREEDCDMTSNNCDLEEQKA